eukprot:g28430.t1
MKKHAVLLLTSAVGVAAETWNCTVAQESPAHLHLNCSGQLFVPMHHSDKPPAAAAVLGRSIVSAGRLREAAFCAHCAADQLDA